MYACIGGVVITVIGQNASKMQCPLRWLNTVLAFSEYRSFVKMWQEKGCSSQAETWQVKNILMKELLTDG